MPAVYFNNDSTTNAYPPSIAVAPDSINKTLAEGDTLTADLAIMNAGTGPLNWRINGIPAVVSKRVSSPRVFHGDMSLSKRSSPPKLEKETTSSTAPVKKSSYGIPGGILVAVSAATSWYDNETNGLTGTLTELGFNYVIVNSFTEADTLGANVFIIRSGSYSPYFNYQNSDLDNWVYSGKGAVQIGDWENGFASDWQSLNYWMEPIIVQVNDQSNPVMRGLPGSWQTYGYWSGNTIAGATDQSMPDLLSCWAYHQSRMVTAMQFGLGRGVFIGFNVYGDLAGEWDKLLLSNSINWASGKLSPWIHPVPFSGIIAPGDTGRVQIKLNAGSLSVGQYRDNLVVSSNDPMKSCAEVGVTMILAPPPNNVVAGTGFNGIVPLTWSQIWDPSAMPVRAGTPTGGISTTPSGSAKASGGFPATYTTLNSSASKGRVNSIKEFSFTATPERDAPVKQSITVNHYNIYRSTTPGGPYSLIASVTASGRPYGDNGDFIDSTVTNGTTYCYVLTAVYSKGESMYSEEVSTTPKAGGHTLVSPLTPTLPVIDGVISPGEWSDATVKDITTPGVPATIRMFIKNTIGTLFLAFEEIDTISINYNYNGVGIYFDADHNRAWNPNALEGNFRIDFYSDTTYTYFRWITGTHPNVRFSSSVPNPNGVAAKGAFSTGHFQGEAAIDLSSPYFASAADTLGLWVFGDGPWHASSYYRYDGTWQYGSIWIAPQTYGNLALTRPRIFARPLQSSWNLVSWNVSPQADSTKSILANVMPDLVVALGFDQVGLTYDPSIPSDYNTLQVMDCLHGYWLKTDNVDTLDIQGLKVNPQTPMDLAKS